MDELDVTKNRCTGSLITTQYFLRYRVLMVMLCIQKFSDPHKYYYYNLIVLGIASVQMTRPFLHASKAAMAAGK